MARSFEFFRSDVRHEEDVRGLIDKTVERFGRLDIAVNNAGRKGVPGRVTEQTDESYAAIFDTNVLGTLLSMKQDMRVMLAQGSGSIVNVSSTYGHTGAAGASIYVASKHAVEGATKSAALEVAGTGVRVNVGIRCEFGSRGVFRGNPEQDSEGLYGQHRDFGIVLSEHVPAIRAEPKHAKKIPPGQEGR